MLTLLDSPIAWTALTLAVYLMLCVLARTLGRPDHRADGLGVVACMMLMVWLPTGAVQMLLLGLLGLFLLALPSGGPGARLLVTGFFGTLIWALSSLVPGGLGTILLCLVALVLSILVLQSYRRLALLRRPLPLERQEKRSAVLAVTGRAAGKLLDVPGIDDQQGVAWLMQWTARDGLRADSGRLRLDTDRGPVLVELGGAEVELEKSSDTHSDKRLALAEQYLSPEQQKGERDELKDIAVHWFPRDATFTVVGRPTWEAPPAELVGDYRGELYVPVFRAGEGELYIADCDRAELMRRTSWGILSKLGYGGLFGALAAERMLRAFL